MKSKLFLSLSLLTAVFSVQAHDLHLLKMFPNASFGFKKAIITEAASELASNPLALGKAFSPAIALGTGVVGYAAYDKHSTNQAELATKQVELANQEFENKQTKLADQINAKSYLQTAKDGFRSAYDTVATKASDLYTNATYENMKNGAISGFNTAKTFAIENPYKTTGAVAASAALVYGAYKLYNSEMFAKSKKQTAPVVTAPVVKAPRLVKKSFGGYAV